MAFHRKPPRGYYAKQFPLWHYFEYKITLQCEDETKNTYIATLLRTSELAVTPEAVEVNPTNANYVEDVGPVIHHGSIVPQMSLSMSATMTKVAIETDKLRTINFKWLPIYSSFLSSLEAEDSKTAVQVGDILELQHDVTNKDVYPQHVSIVSSQSNQPLSTVAYAEAFGDYGLTASAELEPVAFDEALFWKAKRYYGNRGMLNKVTGKFTTVNLKRDKPYFYSTDNYTHPNVKRGNDYTYCGILIHMPQANEAGQMFDSSETTPIDHVDVTLRVAYPEWNPVFEQAAL